MSSNQRWLWAGAGVILIAFALRVYQLAAQSMWWDEAFVIAVGRLGIPQFLDPVFEDRGHPPGFYFLMTLWSVLGIQEFIARFFPLLWGVATVPLLYRLGERIAGKGVGITAALLLAFSPFHLWYSQEARMYAPLGFVATASCLLFWRILRRVRAAEIALYGVTSMVGFYLHHLFPLVLLAQFVFLVFKRRAYPRVLAPWFGANLVAGLLYLPWLGAILLTGGYATARIGWIPPVNWYDPLLSLYSLLLGPTNDPAALWTWVTPTILGALAIYAPVTARKTPHADAAQFLALWLGLPVLFLFLVSLPLPLAYKRSIYLDRFLILVLPALMLLAAWGGVRIYASHPRLIVALGALAALPIALSISNNYTRAAYARDDWRGVSELLQTTPPNADARIVLGADMILPYAYYDRAHLPQSAVPDGMDDPANWLTDELKRTKPREIWLIRATVPANAHLFAPTKQAQWLNVLRDPLKEWLDQHFPLEAERAFQGLYVARYHTAPQQ